MDQLRLRAHPGSTDAGAASVNSGTAPLNDRTTTPGTSSPQQRRRSGPTVSWYSRLLIVGALLVVAGWEIFRLLLAVLTLDERPAARWLWLEKDG